MIRVFGLLVCFMIVGYATDGKSGPWSQDVVFVPDVAGSHDGENHASWSGFHPAWGRRMIGCK